VACFGLVPGSQVGVLNLKATTMQLVIPQRKEAMLSFDAHKASAHKC
jgi:hypothetical protein